MTLRMRVELVIFTFALALFLTAQSKVDRTQPNVNWITNTVPLQATDSIDLSNVTNLAALFETRQPNKVTIWFRYYCDARPDAFGIITTNVWPVTLSNATQMVLSHLKTRPGNWTFITITGIWRDE